MLQWHSQSLYHWNMQNVSFHTFEFTSHTTKSKFHITEISSNCLTYIGYKFSFLLFCCSVLIQQLNAITFFCNSVGHCNSLRILFNATTCGTYHSILLNSLSTEHQYLLISWHMFDFMFLLFCSFVIRVTTYQAEYPYHSMSF